MWGKCAKAYETDTEPREHEGVIKSCRFVYFDSRIEVISAEGSRKYVCYESSLWYGMY